VLESGSGSSLLPRQKSQDPPARVSVVEHWIEVDRKVDHSLLDRPVNSTNGNTLDCLDNTGVHQFAPRPERPNDVVNFNIEL